MFLVHDVAFERSVVIVSANGSGKSRLGYWLEQHHQQVVPQPHALPRISANRMLRLSDAANRLSREQANRQVAWGADHQQPSRVQGDPVVGVLDDFQFVADALFAEQDAQALAFMKAAADLQKPLERPSPTILDRTQSVWQAVFPERRLVFEDYNIRAQTLTGSTTYGASQLSDGERVGLYLIGHTLLTPQDAVLLIDEPELHLHESIQRLTSISPTGHSVSDLSAAVAAAATSADPQVAYSDAEAIIDQAINSGHYAHQLAVLRNKGVLAQVAQVLGIAVTHYRRLALAAVRTDAAVRAALETELPALP